MHVRTLHGRDGPRPATPFDWDVVAELPDAYAIGRLHLGRSRRLDLMDPVAKPGPSPAVEAARAAVGVRGTLHWMRFPFAEVERHGDQTVVRFVDARYARPGDRGFGTATVRLDDRLRVVGAGPGSRVRRLR